MNRIKASLLIIILFAGSHSAQNIEAGVISDKTIFMEREPIYTIFYLTNNGSDPVEIFPFDYHGAKTIKITVTDQNKTKLRLTCPLLHGDGMWNSHIFNPGDTIVSWLEIGGHFGQEKGFRVYSPGYSTEYLLPGKYSCEISYTVSLENSIVSKPFEFEVIQSDEDGKKILELLKPAAQDYWNRNYSDQFNKLNGVIRKYPDHPYSLLACTQIFLDLPGDIIQNEEAKELLKRCTETFTNQIAINQILSAAQKYIYDKEFLENQRKSLMNNNDMWLKFYKLLQK